MRTSSPIEGHQIFPLRLDEPRFCRQSGALHLLGSPALTVDAIIRRDDPALAERDLEVRVLSEIVARRNVDKRM